MDKDIYFSLILIFYLIPTGQNKTKIPFGNIKKTAYLSSLQEELELPVKATFPSRSWICGAMPSLYK